jgi:hypothetical protein
VQVKIVRRPVTSVTVLSIKSYGPGWVDSKLRATVEVLPPDGDAHRDGAPPSSALEIEGYHAIQSSVNFPHRILLPDGGARVGDTIRATFDLIQGHAFKISGLALCHLDDE